MVFIIIRVVPQVVFIIIRVVPQSGLHYNQGGPSQWSLLRVVFIIIRGGPSQWSLLRVVFSGSLTVVFIIIIRGVPQVVFIIIRGVPHSGLSSEWSLLGGPSIMVVPHQWSLLRVVFITVRVWSIMFQWFLLRVVFHHRFTVLTYLGLLWVNVFSPKEQKYIIYNTGCLQLDNSAKLVCTSQCPL